MDSTSSSVEFEGELFCNPRRNGIRLSLREASDARNDLDGSISELVERFQQFIRATGGREAVHKLYGDTYDLREWLRNNPDPNDKPSWTSVGEIPGPYRPNVVVSPIMTLDPRVVPEGGFSPVKPMVPAEPEPADDYAIWLVMSAAVVLAGRGIYYTGGKKLAKPIAKATPRIIKVLAQWAKEKTGFAGAMGVGAVGWLIKVKVDEATGMKPSPHGSGSGQSGQSGQTGDGQSPRGGSVEYGHPDQPDKPQGGDNSSKNSGGTSSGGTAGGQSSGSTSGGSSSNATVHVEVGASSDDDDWIPQPDAGVTDETPNPEESGGGSEGPAERWWEALPWLDPFVVVNTLNSPIGTDEGGENIVVRPGDAGTSTQLTAFLLPRPVGVEEGGEGLVIHIDQIQTTGSSSGTSNTDGWGDTPQTHAEAYAAMRIRVGTFSTR